MALEVDQLIEPGKIPLGGEDQFVFLTVVSHFKGGVQESREQGCFTQADELLLDSGAIPYIQKLPQLGFHFGKGSPGLLGALPETGIEPGQGQTAAAVVDHLLGVLIAGTGFQSLLEIAQGLSLLIQVVIGIAHTEIPVVIPLEVLLIGQEQGQCLFIHFLVIHIGGIVVGPGELTAQLGGAALFGDGFDGVDDLLVLVLLVPDLTLFQQGHDCVLLQQWIGYGKQCFLYGKICAGRKDFYQCSA